MRRGRRWRLPIPHQPLHRQGDRDDDLTAAAILPKNVARAQQLPPASTRKNASMSASVAVSPSPLKSAEPQVGQQLPPMQAKKASMSASVPDSPSLLKSLLPQHGWPNE